MYCPDPSAMDDFLKPVPEPFEGNARVIWILEKVLNQHFITAYIQSPAVDSFYKTESDILIGLSQFGSW